MPPAPLEAPAVLDPPPMEDTPTTPQIAVAEPEPAALEASREQQALALLETHDAKAAEFLRAQLAEARGEPREGVPPEA